MWRCLIGLIAACGGAPSERPVVPAPAPAQAAPAPRIPAACPEPPLGDPSQFTLRTVHGFDIAPPQTCDDGSYIRIVRATGSRKLGTARLRDGSFAEGCTDQAHLMNCTDINVGTLLERVQTELAPANIRVGGTGAGPCAPDLDAGYDGWNFATGVHDWKDANRVVAKITELMDRYDVVGYVGASVYAIPCVDFAVDK